MKNWILFLIQDCIWQAFRKAHEGSLSSLRHWSIAIHLQEPPILPTPSSPR